MSLGLSSHKEEERELNPMDSSWCECGQEQGLPVSVYAFSFFSASFLVRILQQFSRLRPWE